MKKKLILIATAIALLCAMVVPTLVLAQSQDTATPSPVTGSLAIIAPRVAAVGATVQMTVFKASDQTPVAGASVWAVSQANITTVKDEMAKLKGEPADQIQAGAQQALNAHATFLGNTDASGKIFHTFNDAGRYVLVAFEASFLPDFRLITIGMPGLPGLAIEATSRAAVGEKIDLTVIQRVTQQGVKGANVWALTPAQAQALKTQIATLRQSGDQAATEAAIQNAVTQGIFLGTTNGDGKIEPQPSFQNAGGYLLIALEQGYRPGLKGILIGTSLQALVIEAPSRAVVGEKVSIAVVDKATQDGVSDASVWALTHVQALALKTQIATLSGNQTAIEQAIQNTVGQGMFLGTTNGDGKLEPQPSFQNAGGYLLITLKQGYRPGLKAIFVAAGPVTNGNS